ncbi:MAG: hypothetical protein HY801_03980 [Candidatus Lindowbacteria bacterium]|nr:hypothetical protein [Candidatus Lindowbacteria bacterium]
MTTERAESVRQAEQKGRKLSFQVDWEGFGAVQSMRKKRTGEISQVVGELIDRFRI